MSLVSIIVPVYNSSKYLSRCIESIVKQSFSCFELLLVDDNSSDDSLIICNKYAEIDDRIRVLHKQNGGVSSARNFGLKYAEGEYITFCDSDDYLKEDYIKLLYEAMKLFGSDMVASGYYYIDEDEIVLQEKKRVLKEYLIKSEEDYLGFCVGSLFQDKVGFEVCTKLFKSSIIKEHGLRFCETCENFAEDLGFTLNYLLYCKKINTIPCIEYMYVQHNGSQTVNNRGRVKLNAMNEISFSLATQIQQINSSKLNEMIPILHFLILNNQYERLPAEKFELVLQSAILEINNLEWYLSQTNSIRKCKKYLVLFFGKEKTKEILIFSEYCRCGNKEKYELAKWCLLKKYRKNIHKMICRKLLGEKIYTSIKRIKGK